MSKYGAVATPYNGRVYSSAMEANDAMWLDSLVKQGNVVNVTPQYPIRIVVNGKPICSHIVDFRVTLPDSREKFVETKGRPTDLWKLKRKLVQALYPEVPYLTNPTEKELLS